MYVVNLHRGVARNPANCLHKAHLLSPVRVLGGHVVYIHICSESIYTQRLCQEFCEQGAPVNCVCKGTPARGWGQCIVYWIGQKFNYAAEVIIKCHRCPASICGTVPVPMNTLITLTVAPGAAGAITILGYQNMKIN